MTDTINEARALLAQWDAQMVGNRAAVVDISGRASGAAASMLLDGPRLLAALVADLDRTRAELAAARAAMPSGRALLMFAAAVPHHPLFSEAMRAECMEAISRMSDAYRAAHPAESAAAEVADAFAAAPDLPEPCAVCSEALCECGAGRAGGGGHE